MTRIARLAAAGGLLASHAGCVETSTSGTVSTAPGVPPFITTIDGSVSTAAVDACRGALDAQTDGAVQVVGSEFSEAASAVYMLVGPQRAPWRCLVANDGRNPSLEFQGSEGAL